MRCVMQKNWSISFKRFSAWLTEIKNYLTLLPVSIKSKKMASEKIKDILLHAVLKVWAKKSCLQVWDLEEKAYKETW